jgi:transposase InsO family protein
MRADMKADINMEATKMALKARNPLSGLIVHSDCGGQYKAKKFRRLLKRRGIRQSMTFAGNCYDKATAESQKLPRSVLQNLCRQRPSQLNFSPLARKDK